MGVWVGEVCVRGGAQLEGVGMWGGGAWEGRTSVFCGVGALTGGDEVDGALARGDSRGGGAGEVMVHAAPSPAVSLQRGTVEAVAS